MIKYWLVIALLALQSLASNAYADITTNLVAHWVCNDNAASTTVTASTGPNGTLVGGDNTADIYVGAGNGPGGSLANAGFTFDGTNDYFTFDDAAVDITQPVTVACWVKTTTTTADRQILGGTDVVDPYNGYALGINVAGNANKFTAWAQGNWVASTSAINTGAWVHVAMTRASAGATPLQLYVNGSSEGSSATSAVGSYTGSRSVGASSDGGAKFPGSVADVRIYSRELSSGDIGELYALGVSSGSPVTIFTQQNR